MVLRRVVITGIGAITPIGNTAQEYWEGLKNGVSGADLIKGFDASKFKTKFACELKDYNPDNYFDRKEHRKIDRYAQYALISSTEAINNAGINPEKIDKDRTGVVFGSGIGGLKTFEDEVIAFAKSDGTPRFSPFFIPKMISDIAAGRISMRFGFRGPNYGVVSACATSTHALIDSFNLIRLGKADVMVTGGAEAAIYASGMGGFNSAQAISTNNDEYKTASRPFDKTRDGFVMGEGSGALIIEDYEHAKKRGATILAELVGTGLTADAYHLTAPHPEGIGANNVMKIAIEEAGISPEDIDYINVHGTATPLGDIAESIAIINVFGEHAYKMNVSSTKSMTGHLLGAAGAIEAIASVFAINHNLIPPTINFKVPDEQIDQNLNLTLNKAQEREVNYALSNTFGFGGHNASVIFKKFSE
jgi:3-oxoacyl-[acyl-carrier-protein] synthase II